MLCREELRMYNPDYCLRPHIVALNKMDLEDAAALRQEVADEVLAVADQLQEQHGADVIVGPAAVVPCSAASGVCPTMFRVLVTYECLDPLTACQHS